MSESNPIQTFFSSACLVKIHRFYSKNMDYVT